MTSLALDRTAWDLVLDASGNWALVSEPYSLAQDVACAIKLFLREAWYDTSRGVPHFQEILGHWPAPALLQSALENAALTVPGVVSAQATIATWTGRNVTGTVQIIDTAGQSAGVEFVS